MTTARDLISASIAKTTYATYMVGLNRFRDWLEATAIALSIPPPPVLTKSELRALLAEPVILGCFAAALHLEGVRASTVSTYMDGVIHFATDLQGHPCPTRDPGVALVLRGMVARAPPAKARPVIRLTELTQLCAAIPELMLHTRGSRYLDEVAAAAQLSLAYFAALRVSEYLATDDPDKLLRRGDISLSDTELLFDLRKTKTNQAGPVQLVRVPARLSPEHPVCPVAFMRAYLRVRDRIFGTDPNRALFLRTNGHPVTARAFNALIKRLAQTAGLPNWKDLTSHNLRAGAPTDAAANGADPLAIQALGRWASHSSPAHYIRDVALLEAAQRAQSALDRAAARLPVPPAGGPRAT